MVFGAVRLGDLTKDWTFPRVLSADGFTQDEEDAICWENLESLPGIYPSRKSQKPAEF